MALPRDVACGPLTSARRPRRRAGRPTRRARQASAGPAPAPSRRLRRADSPTETSNWFRSATAPWCMCPELHQFPHQRRPAPSTNRHRRRPAACACTTALLRAGACRRETMRRTPGGAEASCDHAQSSSPSRTAPDWSRHGRAVLMPTRRTLFRDVRRLRIVSQSRWSFRPRPHEPRREGARNVVIAWNRQQR